MDQARPTRRLLDWRPMGNRPVGRPRQRWQEVVIEDPKKLKVKNWKATTKDRRTWRDLAEKAKTHKELQCQMMLMMIDCYFLQHILQVKLPALEKTENLQQF
jgi:hypothetical protein